MHLIIQSSNTFSIKNIVTVMKMLDDIKLFYKFTLKINSKKYFSKNIKLLKG